MHEEKPESNHSPLLIVKKKKKKKKKKYKLKNEGVIQKEYDFDIRERRKKKT